MAHFNLNDGTTRAHMDRLVMEADAMDEMNDIAADFPFGSTFIEDGIELEYPSQEWFESEPQKKREEQLNQFRNWQQSIADADRGMGDCEDDIGTID